MVSAAILARSGSCAGLGGGTACRREFWLAASTAIGGLVDVGVVEAAVDLTNRAAAATGHAFAAVPLRSPAAGSLSGTRAARQSGRPTRQPARICAYLVGPSERRR